MALGDGRFVPDSDDPVVINFPAARTQVNYMTGPVVADTVVSTTDADEAGTTMAQYVVTAVLSDTLSAQLYVGGTASGTTVSIARPYEHRQSLFDGQTVGGESFVYSDANNRVRTDAFGIPHVEAFGPAYIPNTTLIYASEVADVDISGVELIDTNNGNRGWVEVIEGQKSFQIITIEGDYFTCFELFHDGSVGADIYNVAKPFRLRRTPFDALTFNGIAYVYSDNVTRVATKSGETQTETIIPSWLVTLDVIYGSYMGNGTGVNAADASTIVWIADAAGRAWTRIL